MHIFKTIHFTNIGYVIECSDSAFGIEVYMEVAFLVETTNNYQIIQNTITEFVSSFANKKCIVAGDEVTFSPTQWIRFIYRDDLQELHVRIQNNKLTFKQYMNLNSREYIWKRENTNGFFTLILDYSHKDMKIDYLLPVYYLGCDKAYFSCPTNKKDVLLKYLKKSKLDYSISGVGMS